MSVGAKGGNGAAAASSGPDDADESGAGASEPKAAESEAGAGASEPQTEGQAEGQSEGQTDGHVGAAGLDGQAEQTSRRPESGAAASEPQVDGQAVGQVDGHVGAAGLDGQAEQTSRRPESGAGASEPQVDGQAEQAWRRSESGAAASESGAAASEPQVDGQAEQASRRPESGAAASEPGAAASEPQVDGQAEGHVSATGADGQVKRASRRFPLFTRDTARPEGGGRAASGDAPAPARQWPLLAVIATVAIGLLLTALDVFRVGTILIGVALIAGAVLRWALPDVGMLAVRSRFTDMVTYGVLGVAIVLLALMAQPKPWLEIPFLSDTLHRTITT